MKTERQESQKWLESNALVCKGDLKSFEGRVMPLPPGPPGTKVPILSQDVVRIRGPSLKNRRPHEELSFSPSSPRMCLDGCGSCS